MEEESVEKQYGGISKQKTYRFDILVRQLAATALTMWDYV
jgi:hypothetical protein